MAALQTHLFRCLSDNYGLLVHDPESGETLSVDAPDGVAVLDALDARGWRLSHVLLTHHHPDHVGGLGMLKTRAGVRVFGPESDRGRVPGIDEGVREGSVVRFAGREFLVLETPGHAAGHVAYWSPDDGLAFVGDTLFVMGCGRILEGTAEELWHSLTKLAELPPATQVYCGHEYTVSNGRFAASVDPGNAAVAARLAEAEKLIAGGKPTLPTTIAAERATNPFLRAAEPALAEAVGMKGAAPVAVFAALRERKNRS